MPCMTLVNMFFHVIHVLTYLNVGPAESVSISISMFHVLMFVFINMRER